MDGPCGEATDATPWSSTLTGPASGHRGLLLAVATRAKAVCEYAPRRAGGFLKLTHAKDPLAAVMATLANWRGRDDAKS